MGDAGDVGEPLNVSDLNRSEFTNLLRELENKYHNGISNTTDALYDELIIIFNRKFGNSYTPPIGAKPEGKKTRLPYFLASLDKTRCAKTTERWSSKYGGPYVVEDKIDGLTLLIVYKKNGDVKMYTRGDGVEGIDVSHLYPYICLPSLNMDIAIRGEIVLKRKEFEEIGEGYMNARNMVSGIVTSEKSFSPELAARMTFIAFHILNYQKTRVEEHLYLEHMGFTTSNPVRTLEIEHIALEEYLKERKNDSEYEIDGLVIYQDLAGIYPENSNPKNIIALKSIGDVKTVVVTHIRWEARSYLGRIIPVVCFDKVLIDGANIGAATGHNAGNIINNMIGPGALIIISRSGSTIPKIEAIVEKSDCECWPDTKVFGAYDWDAYGTHLIVEEGSAMRDAAKLERFISGLKIPNCGPSRIEAMWNAGITDLDKLLSCNKEDLKDIPGIGDKLSSQIFDGIHSGLSAMDGAQLMAASGIFPNIGEKRFASIFEVYPDFMSLRHKSKDELALMILKVKGFKNMAYDIADAMPIFAEWINSNVEMSQSIEHGVKVYRIKEEKPSLKGLTFVFSGFRDGRIEMKVRERGGKVSSSISKNTSLLVMKDPSDMKTKARKAMDLNIPIIDKERFIELYDI